MSISDVACLDSVTLKSSVPTHPIKSFQISGYPKQYKNVYRFLALWAGLILFAALACLPLRAQAAQAVFNTGPSPVAVAVNPVTDRIYIANQGTTGVTGSKCEIDSSGYGVTIVDGATNTTQTIPVGFCPQAIAVNPVANKIYVAQGYDTSSAVTVIDGATLATTNVQVGGNLTAFAVNPVTNKVYVVSRFDNAVWEIDGKTNAATRIPVGNNPASIAVNSVTDKIYVADVGNLFNDGNVAVIDGATNQVSYRSIFGQSPQGIAVNPTTNEVFVSYATGLEVLEENLHTTKLGPLNFQSAGAVRVNPVTGTIYVLDYSHSHVYAVSWPPSDSQPTSQTLTMAGPPTGMAVDPVANKIYVSNDFSGYVSVIDGASNQVTNILLNNSSGAADNDVAVNPRTGKSYIVDGSFNNAVVLGATSPSNTLLATGNGPTSVAADSNTNRSYIANGTSNSVTVVDGISDQVVGTVPTGTLPFSIGVNPLTNTVYTAGFLLDSRVTAIDEKTLTPTTVPLQYPPSSLTVDPLTDTTYVGLLSNSLVAISGSNNFVQTVGATGPKPKWIVTNPDTGKVYTINKDGNNVTIFGRQNGSSTTVSVGGAPVSAAVNAATNKVYVANSGDGTVTVIDGTSNATSTIGVGSQPASIAVNAVTDTIYVANKGSNNVTVINGANNSVSTTVGVGSSPTFLAVNPALNRIYVANYDSNNLTVIDGKTNGVLATLPTGSQPQWVAVNLATNKVYVANFNSNNVSIIQGEQLRSIPLVATINPLPNGISSTPNPTFTFKATSAFSPTATVSNAIFFQMDTLNGPWTVATMTGPGAFKATVSSALSGGLHTLYAFATDGQAASQRNSPLISNIAAYTFAAPATSGAASGGQPTFTLTADSRSLPVPHGQSAEVSLTVASLNGFSQPVSFTCSGLPAGASCNFSPASVTPNGGAPATSTLTITTTGATTETAGKGNLSWPFTGGSITMAFAVFLFGKKRRLPAIFCLVLLLSLGGVMVGCGGGTTVVNSGTPLGSSVVTVTGTAGSGASAVTKSVNVALAVQ